MVELKDLFAEINTIGGGRRGGDEIKISDSRGNITNIDSRTHLLKSGTKTQAEAFLSMLSDKTGWTFNVDHWSWGPYRTIKLRKCSIKPGKARYNALLVQNPISLAIISRASIEYTPDSSGLF